MSADDSTTPPVRSKPAKPNAARARTRLRRGGMGYSAGMIVRATSGGKARRGTGGAPLVLEDLYPGRGRGTMGFPRVSRGLDRETIGEN